MDTDSASLKAPSLALLARFTSDQYVGSVFVHYFFRADFMVAYGCKTVLSFEGGREISGMIDMKQARCCQHFSLTVLLCLGSLGAVLLAGQSSAAGSSEVPQDSSTLFDSIESPTKDVGSGEETENDPTSPEVGPVPQRRRSSFRADLGKRFPPDWVRLERKRPSKSSFFRADLGKRGWGLEPPMSPDFENVGGDQLAEARYETMLENIRGSMRRKRFAAGELEGRLEEEGSRSWKDNVEKRPRSSFRADLGKRFEKEHGYEGRDNEEDSEEVEEVGGGVKTKRAKYAFRGDLGKRSLELWEPNEKRRNPFRGDLGRKRSLTLESSWKNRLPLSSSSFDNEERLRKLVDTTKGSGSDPDYGGGLEKKRFRVDLG